MSSVAQLLIGYHILPYFQAPHSYEVWGFSISHVCVCKDFHRYHFYGNNVRLENLKLILINSSSPAKAIKTINKDFHRYHSYGNNASRFI